MQSHYRIAAGKVVETQDEQSSIVAFFTPTEAEKRYCIEQLKLDEHTFSSALDPDELSRLEFEPDHIALIYSRPRNRHATDEFLFRGGTAGAFLFKDRLVIVSADDVPAFSGVQTTRVQSNAGLVLKLILAAVVHFREHLKVISMIADELQKEINTAMENRHLIHLFTLEKSMVFYLNFIHSNSLLLEKIKHNAARIGFTPDEQEVLDDIIIENAQCYKQAEIYSNIIASLMDARASIVGNNLNSLMKTLTIITIAIMAPTLVVSIFSMNVALPLQKNPLAFAIVLALAVISAVAVLLFWFRKR